MYRSNDQDTPIGDLLLDAANLGTPSDEEVRAYWRDRGVFVSSVIADYTAERSAAMRAITSRGARAIAWETITPAPVKAEDAWLGGVDASDALVLLLGARYGARRDDGLSATHAEFERAQARGIPRWVFVDSRGNEERDAPLRRWIEDDLSRRHSYARFDSADALEARIGAKLADAAAFELFTWYKFGDAVLRADTDELVAPDVSGYTGGPRGTFTARGSIAEARIRAYLATARQQRQSESLVVHGQVFEAQLTEFTETTVRGRSGYTATFQLSAVRPHSAAVLDATWSAAGQSWTGNDIARIALQRVLGSTRTPAPPHVGLPEPLHWQALVNRAGGLPQHVHVLASLLVTERAVTHSIVTRVHRVEARLVGPPRSIALRVEGSRGGARGLPTSVVEIEETVRLA